MNAWTNRMATLLAVLAAVVAGTATLHGSAPLVAAAADFCVQDNFTNIIVGKNFSLPGKGKCKEFHGFFPTTPTALFGQACGSSDNERIAFHLTLMAAFQFGSYRFTLDRGSLAGEGRLCVADVQAGDAGQCVDLASVAKIACSPSNVPVP